MHYIASDVGRHFKAAMRVPEKGILEGYMMVSELFVQAWVVFFVAM